MRMLDIDVSELKNLTKVTESEALEFLNEGVPIICRTSARNFREIQKITEYEYQKNLKEQGIHDFLELYIQ